MDKKKLLAMSKLLATPQMKKLAIKDAAETKTPPSHYRGAYRWNENSIGLFLRCRVEDGILMVSLFYPEYLRAGAKEPSYVVYVDRASRQFLTYGTERQKWLTGTVESLSWPAYIRSNSKFILPKKEQGIIKFYLGTEEDGYWGLQSYQQELCMERANTRYAHAVAPWDADMALTPPLPKDWLRWVDKVGIPAQYIFYQYRKGGAKTGYCTYCEKEVPLKQQPYHKKEGRCPCCHRKVQFRAYRASCVPGASLRKFLPLTVDDVGSGRFCCGRLHCAGLRCRFLPGSSCAGKKPPVFQCELQALVLGDAVFSGVIG